MQVEQINVLPINMDISNLCDCDNNSCYNQDNYFSIYSNKVRNLSPLEKLNVIQDALSSSNNSCERIGAFRVLMKNFTPEQALGVQETVTLTIIDKMESDDSAMSYHDIRKGVQKIKQLANEYKKLRIMLESANN